MARKGKSRGRDLRHTETQAALQVSRRVADERGRTNGREAIGAVSAAKPRLRQKSPAVKRNPNLTAADIAALPANATVFANGSGAAKYAVWIDPSRKRVK